jgi:hypothetical protein
MNLIWKPCVGYPGAKPITRFRVHPANQFDTDYYYSIPTPRRRHSRRARPRRATRRVRQANESIPTRFKDEFERFLIAISHDPSTTGPAPWADDPTSPSCPNSTRDEPADIVGVTVEASLFTAASA